MNTEQYYRGRRVLIRDWVTGKAEDAAVLTGETSQNGAGDHFAVVRHPNGTTTYMLTSDLVLVDAAVGTPRVNVDRWGTSWAAGA